MKFVSLLIVIALVFTFNSVDARNHRRKRRGDGSTARGQACNVHSDCISDNCVNKKCA